MWRRQVDAFSGHFQTISCDLRGFGQTPPPDEPYRHCDDLAELLNHLSVEKAHLLGLSLGGLVVLNFALCHPDRVHRVVSAAPIMPGSPPRR